MCETGLDFAQARYLSSTQGRFISVDPLMASAATGEPQSWNRYVYVSNNPLNLTDPTGMLQKPPVVSTITADHVRSDSQTQDGKVTQTPQGGKPTPATITGPDNPAKKPEGTFANAVEVLPIDLDNGVVPKGADGKPIEIKDKDGKPFKHGFGAIIRYQVKLGTETSSIGNNPVASEELEETVDAAPKNVIVDPSPADGKQPLGEGNTFVDTVGIFSQTPVSPGVQSTAKQTLNITAKFGGIEPETNIVRINVIKLDTTKRSVVIKDTTRYSYPQ